MFVAQHHQQHDHVPGHPHREDDGVGGDHERLDQGGEDVLLACVAILT